MQPLDFMQMINQLCPRPTSTGKEYRVHVEVMPDSFTKSTGNVARVINTPAGLGIDLTVAECNDHEYSMVFRENADGKLEPLYVAVCPLCPPDK